jgi:hypothetical protein
MKYFVLIFLLLDFSLSYNQCTVDPHCYGLWHNSYGNPISCKVPGTIALTFNNGPGFYTESILDALDQYGFKATFFAIGYKINASTKNIIQRMITEGHQVASLSYQHIAYTTMSENQINADICEYEQNFIAQGFNDTGFPAENLPTFPGTGKYTNTNSVPNFIRPPFLAMNEEVMIALDGYYVPGSTLSTFSPSNSSDLLTAYQQALDGGIDTTKLSIITTQEETLSSVAEGILALLQWLNDTFVSIKFVTVADCLQLQPYKSINTCTYNCHNDGDDPFCNYACYNNGNANSCTQWCYNNGYANDCTQWCGNDNSAPSCTQWCYNNGNAPICISYCYNNGSHPLCRSNCGNNY